MAATISRAKRGFPRWRRSATTSWPATIARSIWPGCWPRRPTTSTRSWSRRCRRDWRSFRRRWRSSCASSSWIRSWCRRPPRPASRSAPRLAPALDALIARLPRAECDAFLRRLAEGEPLLALKLNRRLQELAGPPARSQPTAARRTWAELPRDRRAAAPGGGTPPTGRGGGQADQRPAGLRAPRAAGLARCPGIDRGKEGAALRRGGGAVGQAARPGRLPGSAAGIPGQTGSLAGAIRQSAGLSGAVT